MTSNELLLRKSRAVPIIDRAIDPFKTPGGDTTPIVAFLNGVICTVASYCLIQNAPWFHKIVLLFFAASCTFLLYQMRFRTADKYGTLSQAFVHSYWGVPEGYLGMLFLLFPIYLLSVDAWQTSKGDPSFFPADRFTVFAALWGLMHVVNSKLSGGSHMQYYKWFNSSGLKLAEKRGLGSRGYAPYGIPTKWLPRPTAEQFSTIKLLKEWLLLSIVLGVTPPALHCTLSLPLYVVFACQLFANTNHGMHKPLLVPAALTYLMLAPQLWSVGRAWGSKEGPLWPAAFLKIHILSIYFAAGVGKPLTAAFMKKCWCGGPTMQYFLFCAMWARPGGNESSRKFHLDSLGFLVERPHLCAFISLSGLLWELIAPIVAFMGSWWSVAFFISAVGLHANIFVSQGIDFFCQWVPVLLIFAVDTHPITFEALLPSPAATGLADSSHMDLLLWLLAASHLLAQIVLCFSCWELCVDGDRGCLPFTSMQMFTVGENIFGDDFLSSFVMMSGDQRCAGHLGIVEWSSPALEDHNLSIEDLQKLPFKVVYFGHTQNKFPMLQSLVKEEYRDLKFLLFANFDIDPVLADHLRAVCTMIRDNEDADVWDREKMKKLVELTKKCQSVFHANLDTWVSRRIERQESFLEDTKDKSLQEKLKIERQLESAGELQRTKSTTLIEKF